MLNSYCGGGCPIVAKRNGAKALKNTLHDDFIQACIHLTESSQSVKSCFTTLDPPPPLFTLAKGGEVKGGCRRGRSGVPVPVVCPPTKVGFTNLPKEYILTSSFFITT